MSKLSIALAYHQAGKFQQADELYREILRTDPKNADALQLSGMLAHHLGRHAEAINLLRAAIALNPGAAEYHSNLATVYLDVQDYQAGEASCREAARCRPELPQIHNNLGNALQGLGKLEEAAASYARALQLEPNYAHAYANLGGLLRRLGRFDEAIASCQRALAIQPDSLAALNNLGEAYRIQGRHEEAVRCYQRALEINPQSAEIHINLGMVFKAMGLLDQAIAFYRHAVQLRPEFSAGHVHLASTLRQVERLEEAAASYRQAIELNPRDAEAHNNLGEIQWQQGQSQAAISSFERSISLAPSFAFAHYNLGTARRGEGELESAAESFRTAIANDAQFAAAWNNLAMTYCEQGKSAEAIDYFKRAMELNPLDPRIHSHFLVCQQYLPNVSLAQLSHDHIEWGQRHAMPLTASRKSLSNQPDPNRPLRVGFVSRDFRRHPVGYFLVRALESLVGSQCTTIGYCDQQRDDDLTDRLRSATVSWTDVYRLTDKQLAVRIEEDAIDILVDLAGHTAGNRLLVFAQKPAPVQATWMGYVGTTGVEGIDYLISDRFHTPVGVDKFYREKIVRLPDGYVCYDPPDDAPTIGPLPALAAGHITFGCFNNPAKISAAAVALWARILARVPQSRLMLKYSGLEDRGAQRHFRALLHEAGVPSERIALLGHAPHPELLAQYNHIDIALDTLPYSGGITTCEALYMGVPVISFPGETFASRHSFSHLSNIGLNEMIAHNQDDYVERAVQLAQNVGELSALRSTLRECVARSPLCDGARFGRGLGMAFRQIWQEWCASVTGQK